jgi:succinoglycan biosynthesis transport protein ExoP
MGFSQFLTILRARLRVALIVFFTTIGVTLLVSFLLPKKYTAVASIVVDIKPDPITGALTGAMLNPSIMATQVDILNSDRVAARVIHNLKLDQIPAYREQWQEETDGKGKFEQWMGDALQKALDVKPSRDSNVISVAFKARDPNAAAGFANAFVQAYLDTSIELSVDPARRYSGFFDARAKAARDALEASQAKLSEFQQANGIVNGDERLDIETSRLNDLSTQLVMMQTLSAESASRQVQAAKGNGDQLQEALGNAVLGGMKVDLSREEAHLQELRARYGDNHPQVIEAKANVAELRSRIDAETRRVTGGVGVSASINRQRTADIQAQLEAQRAKVLKLKAQRDQMAVLQRDVENNQRAYDNIAARKDQTNLESQNQQTNVNVLSAAQPPVEASSPKIVLNALLSIFLGGLLAIGTVLGREMTDRRVRSGRDIIDALGLPVLGVMPRPALPRNKRLAQVGSRVISGRLAAPTKG